MRWQRRYQHIQIGLKKRSISDYSSGMVSYVAIYIMLILLVLILGMNRLATLSLSNTTDEMRLIASHYAAERGARWFVTYCNNGGRWDYSEAIDVEKNDTIHIYIKADPKVTNPKHVMSCAVLDGVSSRVHIYVKEKGDYVITKEDVMKIAYEEEFIEKEFIKMYKKGKILITLTGEKVGSVNGLAVLDTGYYSFGRPIRITCVAYRGTGRIVDIQKESNLSGKIHEKSISILRGLLSSLLNAYESIPVDFHVSFEQTYGIVDGDSASIAEIITLLSALSKYKVKQNIAVTGSVNQFGEVQAIGGVSEKIEGFYKVCK